MSLNKAVKILSEKNLYYCDYFTLCSLDKKDNTLEVKEAIDRVKDFILKGKK